MNISPVYQDDVVLSSIHVKRTFFILFFECSSRWKSRHGLEASNMHCIQLFRQQLWRQTRAHPVPKKAYMGSVASYTVEIPNTDVRNCFSTSSSASTISKRPFSSSTTPSPEAIFSNYRNIDISDGPIRVYEHGPQTANDTLTSKLPVLLLHGAMLDTAPFIWRHLMPTLSTKRRVLAIDMPRHGGSRPWPSSTTATLDQTKFESILTEVLDALSLPRVSLIGLSMGGGVATGYSLSHPSRISALVSINPGGLEKKRPWQFTTWLGTRNAAFLRFSSRWLASSPDTLRSMMAQNFVAGSQTRDFEALMALVGDEARERARHDEPALDDWQVAAYGPGRMNVHFLPGIEGLEMPSLWMHGEKDNLITEDIMRYAAELAEGQFVNIPDAGHIATLDQPERVHESIEGFLDEGGV